MRVGKLTDFSASEVADGVALASSSEYGVGSRCLLSASSKRNGVCRLSALQEREP